MTVAYLNPEEQSGFIQKVESSGDTPLRDYYYDYKRVVLAYGAEFAVAAGSLVGAVLFAKKYGHNDTTQVLMMMLAPIAYAVVEICRVPLALSVRAQPSRIVRVLAAVGLIAAAGVTVKSVSQLGQIMFQPRLIDVVHAKAELEESKNFKASLETKIQAADAVVEQRREELKTLDDRLKSAGDQLVALPKPVCVPISGYNRDGRFWRSTRCTTDPRTGTLQGSLHRADAARKMTGDALNAATAERASLDRTTTDNDVTAAQTRYQEAVLNSQLHSFTGMVFGKSPQEVTEGELYWFLNIFVFLPAICVAFASSLIALTAVVRIKPPEPATVPVDDEAARVFIGPYAEMITHAAIAAAQESVAQEIDSRIARAKRRSIRDVMGGFFGRGLGGLGFNRA